MVGLPGAKAHAQTVIVAPDACVATMAPVYYDGYASYWCGDTWYYRNGPDWGRYDREPGFLHEYRGTHYREPQLYGRSRAGGGARAGGGDRDGHDHGGRDHGGRDHDARDHGGHDHGGGHR